MVHASELAEDYVEVILDLNEQVGEARIVDIAMRLGVAHPTVGKAMRKLEREGLVRLTAYKPIELTESGLRLAQSCRERHRVVVNFLLALGVEPDVAEVDAEGIEHHVSESTISKMALFCAGK